MAWRYRCGTCDTAWGWMSKEAADAVRRRHREQRHDGGIPGKEEFTSDAQSATDNPVALLITGALFAFGALVWIWQQITGT
ncbi:hypothetical protein ACFTWH_08365 [Streptomyces sp. NPDC057011]|uniref:hypothetical protein n=1 Tax=unclassified Streptomyces TaxID=2593676 RepID=UPI003641AFBA